MLNWLKQNTANARARMAAEVVKFKNRTFMEAVVTGCALVAAADGSIESAEKQKMAGFIERADELRHFDMRQVIEVFQKAAGDLEFDHTIGKATALKKIGRIRGNEEQARLLVRIVCAIGAADGDFDSQERAVVAEIAKELGLNPADFDL
ncbi:MAG: tellurite resistance TerB family protein [Rhodobacteraceae bacterium]|nr:tellurite resistance TerB family protein [Paracoccaceae bacterium]